MFRFEGWCKEKHSDSWLDSLFLLLWIVIFNVPWLLPIQWFSAINWPWWNCYLKFISKNIKRLNSNSINFFKCIDTLSLWHLSVKELTISVSKTPAAKMKIVCENCCTYPPQINPTTPNNVIIIRDSLSARPCPLKSWKFDK